MWHLKEIPKILHVYFGGPVAYLRYLTIYSFRKQNPDWEIKFYYPKRVYKKNTWLSNEQEYIFKSKNYFNKIKKLGIEVIKVDFKEFTL